MQDRLISGVALAAALLISAAALADTVSVAGQDVVLVAPKGRCAFDRSQSAERSMIATLERANAGINDVLMVFGPCKTLEQSRAGKGMPFSEGQILASYDNGAPRVFDGFSREQVLREVAATLPKLDWQALAQKMSDAWKSEGVNLPTNSLSSLGVLATDADAIYFGVMMSTKGPDGRPLAVAGVVGITLVNKVMLSINLYGPYADKSSVDALLKAQRENIRALIKANDAPAAADAPSSGIDWQEVGISSAIGGGIFLLMIGLYVFVQRLRDALNS